MEKRNIKKEMKNKFYFIVFLLLALSIFLFLIVFYINSLMVLEKKEIVATLRTGDTAGFDVNTTALTFGTISFGTFSQRSLILENNYDFPLEVEFKVKGNITKFLIFDKFVYLESNEKKSVQISTITLTENDSGNYSGKMIVLFKKRLL